MKKISVALILILVLGISIGCFLRTKNQNFLSYEEVKDIYNDNKEIINNIKDGLFSSEFIPRGWYPGSDMNTADDNEIILTYNGNQLFCIDDPNDEKLLSIQNVHIDAIEYFTRINENFNPCIIFREVFGNTVIEFDFYDKKSGISAGILYTTVSEVFGGKIHLEDNWYAYSYKLG